MIERPINLYQHEVRAILDGRQTQLRRKIRRQPSSRAKSFGVLHSHTSKALEIVFLEGEGDFESPVTGVYRCPFGFAGDRLWGREIWGTFAGPSIICCEGNLPNYESPSGTHHPIAYLSGNEHTAWGLYGPPLWQTPRLMQRRSSRIDLEITGIRVERLQDISESDAWAEGCEGFDDDVTGGESGYAEYRKLWESINGHGSWEANPWVWVIEFRRIKP